VSSTESTPIHEIARLERRAVDVDLARDYQEIGIRSFGSGIFHKVPLSGAELGSKRVFWIKPDDLVLNNVFAWEGAIAVAGKKEDGLIGSHRFMTYVVNRRRADPHYLLYYFLSEPGMELIRRASPGSAGRNRTLGIQAFESLHIPLPPIGVQRQIASFLDVIRANAQGVRSRQSRAARRVAALVTALVTRDDLPDTQKRENGWQRLLLGEVMSASNVGEVVKPDGLYRIAGVYSFGRGLIDRGTISGSDTKYRSLARLAADDIVISRLGAWEGAVAVVDEQFAGAYVSSEFPIFSPNREMLDPSYFAGIARSPWLWDAIDGSTRGSMARRKRVKAEQFLSIEVWLPPRVEQGRVADLLEKALAAERMIAHSRSLITALEPAALNEAIVAVA
jgi:type I restriction enzyme S subunit